MHGAAPPEVQAARAAGLFAVPAIPAAPAGAATSGRLRPDAGTPPPLTPTGEWHIPVILVSFAGEEPRFPPERFQTLLFDTTGAMPNGSMSEYYRDVSRGQLRVTGDIVGWYALPESMSYFGNNGYGLNRLGFPQNLAGLVEEAVAQADPDIDFAKYDRNGDGEVDYLLLVHVGIGAEAGAGNRNLLWSVNTSLSGPWEFVTPYRTQDHAARATTPIYVNRFSVLPERSWIDPDSMAEIGPYCHEFGHGLGWPDLYDASVIGGGYNVGPGNWCLMASGAYGGDDRSPQTPTRPCAWSMQDVGWIPTTNVVKSGPLDLPPVEGPDAKIYRMWWQGEASPEEYLLENRQKIGHDSSLPGDGMLVYHVDEGIIAQNRQQNRVNSNAVPGLRVEEADGGYQLLGTFDRGSPGDPFPGSTNNTRFADDTQPSSRTFDGRHTNLSLSGIQKVGSDIQAWAQIDPQGWSVPWVSRLSTRLHFGGTRVLAREGNGALAFLAINESDSSRVCALGVKRGNQWSIPVRVSTFPGASEAAWSEPGGTGRRTALWVDRRTGFAEVWYRYWDSGVPGPEMRATFSHGHAHKPAGFWLPDGRFLLVWIDDRSGSKQLYWKTFYYGQESTAPEAALSRSYVTPIINDFTLAATGLHAMVAYVAEMLNGSNIYFQDWYGTSSWSTPARLSYDELDVNPVTEYIPGGLIRLCWLDQDIGHSIVNSVVYDPVARGISTSQFQIASSDWNMARPHFAPARAGAPIALVEVADDPPHDQLLFSSMGTDGIWDADMGKINGGLNVSDAQPFVDVWDDGSMHVYWFRTPPIVGLTELGSMWRAGTVAQPMATERDSASVAKAASVALGPTLTVVPNPARGSVMLSWNGEMPAGARLMIYSVTGRLVTQAPLGALSFRWDGRDAAGGGVAAGVYWAKLASDSGFKAEKKVVLLK